MSQKFLKCYTLFRIAHFTVLCSVVRPLNRNEAKDDVTFQIYMYIVQFYAKPRFKAEARLHLTQFLKWSIA